MFIISVFILYWSTRVKIAFSWPNCNSLLKRLGLTVRLHSSSRMTGGSWLVSPTNINFLPSVMGPNTVVWRSWLASSMIHTSKSIVLKSGSLLEMQVDPYMLVVSRMFLSWSVSWADSMTCEIRFSLFIDTILLVFYS